MRNFTIRRAASERDIALIAPMFDLYRQFYDKPPDPKLAEAFIRERLQKNESVIFLATAPKGGSEKALGFVQLYPSFSSVSAFRVWVLNDLFVSPSARRSGVGRALMESARRHAIETGAKRLTLETVAENRAAWSLYESLGYVAHHTSARFYALDLD